MMGSLGVLFLLTFLALTDIPTSYGVLDVGNPMTLTSQFLSREEVLRTVEGLEAGDSDDAGEVMMTETRNIEGQTLLKLKSEKREISMRLEPSYRLIKPSARLTFTDGDEERDSTIDPLVRSSLYHGSIEGNPSSIASLVRNNDGWNGMIMTNTGRFILHGVTGSSRSLLIPMSSKAEDLHQSSSLYDMMSREEVFNMTGDESFSRQDSEFELEVGVYTDKALYEYVKTKYPNDNIKQKVQEVVLITLNTVHTYYQKPSMGNKIAVVVASMNIVTGSDPPDLKSNLKMLDYLDNFCNWDADKKNPRGTKYDFGLLFSGLDMYGDNPQATSTAGMAPVSRMCLFNTKRSCAIGEAIGFGSGIIMSHEIGHNLGMYHDSEGNNCPGKGFVMGAMISAGATQFSSCSKDYLQAYIESLDEFGQNCMRKRVGTSSKDHSVANKLPGERLSEGEQCRYALGDGWAEYTSQPNFCAAMWCRKGRNLSSPNGGPPLPGTPCGDNKICYDGKCSDKTKVHEIIDNYKPTNSGSTGKALPLDELCQKYAPKYPQALTYKSSQGLNINFGDLSGICSKGMRCFSGYNVMILNHLAPPGTSCAKGKACKNYECVDDGSGTSDGSSSGSSGGSSSGSTGGSSGTSSSGATHKPVQGEITGSQLDIVNGICVQAKGSGWEAFCTGTNMEAFPQYTAYCPGEVCSMNLCVKKTSSQTNLSSAYAKDGTSCGGGKHCSRQRCV